MGSRGKCEMCMEKPWQEIVSGHRLCLDCKAKREERQKQKSRNRRGKRSRERGRGKVELPW